MSMGKQSAPETPNYRGAAEETSAGNLAAARQATTANRVNQVTPYGKLNYSVTGKDAYGNDIWTAEQELSPEQKQLLDYQNQTSVGLGGLQNQQLDYVKNMLSKPFDTSRLPAEQINPGQTAQDALMSRLNPAFEGRQAALETQLANQGIGRGTEAYKNAQSGLDQARNDAYTQAALQGMNIGQQARQQSMQEQSFLRNEPLNALNAIRAGSQVQGPNFVNAPQQATAQGADYLGAAQAQYQGESGNANAGNAMTGNFMGGLMNMGATYMANRGSKGGSTGGTTK